MARFGIDRKINKALKGFTAAVTGLTKACSELQTEKQGLLDLNDSRDAQIARIKTSQQVTTGEADQCQADTDRLSRIAAKINDLLS